MTYFISVVVCTYNREGLISGCLDSLAEQTAKPSSFEVLVIDNNSTDNTYKVVSDYSRLPNLRLVSEPMQGLSHARNRGLREANGDYVAYLDDDARADSQYLENLLILLDQFSNSVDCYGGPILPFYTTEKPAWFKDEYEIRRLRTDAGFEGRGKTFSGSNMIWKRSVLESLGGFDPNLGMVADIIWGGEETNLFKQLWSQGQPRLYYSPKLIVFHWVPYWKMKVKYKIKRAFISGQTLGIIETHNYSNWKRLGYLFGRLGRVIVNLVKAIIHSLKYRNLKNWLIEELSYFFLELGKSSASIKIRSKLTNL